MICPVCSGPMKPLFTGFFCPKDCDRAAPSTGSGIDRFVFTWTYKGKAERWEAVRGDGETVKVSPGDYGHITGSKVFYTLDEFLDSLRGAYGGQVGFEFSPIAFNLAVGKHAWRIRRVS